MNAIRKTQRLRPQISQAEKEARQEAVDFARGSVRFEGIILEPGVEEIARQYVAGELTMDEMVESIKALVLGSPRDNTRTSPTDDAPAP